jgi:DNA-binding YbaB/EbfC family protein
MFKGLGSLKDLGSLLKQAQEIGSKMQAINEELKIKRAVGQAGGGLVAVEVNGLAEVLSVRIDPSLVEKRDREMIEDLLPAAFSSAQRKAKQMYAEAMHSLTGGLPVPGVEDAIARLSDESGDDESAQ